LAYKNVVILKWSSAIFTKIGLLFNRVKLSKTIKENTLGEALKKLAMSMIVPYFFSKPCEASKKGNGKGILTLNL
jgi:hypothetical protein